MVDTCPNCGGPIIIENDDITLFAFAVTCKGEQPRNIPDGKYECFKCEKCNKQGLKADDQGSIKMHNGIMWFNGKKVRRILPYEIIDPLVFMKNMYEEELKDGRIQTTIIAPDGTKYAGEFKDGTFDGKGTYTNPDGRIYIGEFKNGQIHGHGKTTSPDGTEYIGEYKDGKENGQGTIKWATGRKYTGQWKDGKLHGQGTLSFPNGQEFIGGFKDGNFHGKGILTTPNGVNQTAEWEDGDLIRKLY
jgi:hypothetical protein